MNKFLASLVACALATPVTTQDFSAEADARPWNLYAEVPARFEAKVVDILCELTDDCAPACGAGTRQMGLLRRADNVLVLAMKNAQAAFSGAVDLAPFRGQTVTVDALLIDDPDLGAKTSTSCKRSRQERRLGRHEHLHQGLGRQKPRFHRRGAMVPPRSPHHRLHRAKRLSQPRP